MFTFIGRSVGTLRLALPKVAVGWMFALLTIDFNRVAIVEMGVAAVIVTSLLSIHYFLAPFQVIAGRVADCFPVMGYRRTPYMIGASVLASLLFLLIPRVTFSMGTGTPASFVAALFLFVMFGVCMAVIADSYHSLIAENVSKKTRPMVIAVAWIVMILSTIIAAVVMNKIRPTFTPEAMQRLYNLTPFIVIGAVLLGVVGKEKRLLPEQLDAARDKARALAPPGNPLTSALTLVRSNPHTRHFFMFIAVAIFGIFLHESLIEVFGATVFGLDIKATTRLQPIWGAGVLLGMIVTGAVSTLLKIPRQVSTTVGCAGAALGFAVLGVAGWLGIEAMLIPTVFFLGLAAGVFNVGALSLMMDMTIEGATGLYMGLWGVAQAIGMGLSSVMAGALHSSLIASGLLPEGFGYLLIFGAEAAMLLVAIWLLRRVNAEAFQNQAGGSNPPPATIQPRFVGALGNANG